MNLTLIVILLALLWAAITGSFTAPNLLLGLVLAGVAIFVLRSAFAPPRVLRKARRVLSLGVMFFYELMMSALKVAKIVLTPNMTAALKPAFVAFPLTVTSDAEITLLANLITLTPGTLSVDVSADRKLLYVHVLALDTEDALIAEIASGFESKVREVFQ